MRALTSILFFLLAGVGLFAQSAGWEVKLGTEIYNPTLSPDGKHLLYFTNDDSVVATCFNVAKGSKVWSRSLKNFNEYRIGRFVGNDTVLVGQENRYEFLRANDGSLIASLPIVGEDWGDLQWEPKAPEDSDTLKPYFKGSLGIFYFDDGMQVIDLTTPAIVYQTESAPSAIKYKEWESVLMINPTSGADSLYFVDFQAKKVAYCGSKDDNDLNSSVYQTFAISNSELLLFNEDNIQSVDLKTGKSNAIIPVDPDDPEFYTPVIFKKALYLMVSDEGIQKLYLTKEGKLLWQTDPGAVPGIAEQLIELENDEALLMAYNDDKMTTYKINASTGKTLWNKQLFTQDGELETGHKEGSKVWATIARVAIIMLSTQSQSRGRWGTNSGTGMMEYQPNYSYSSFRARRERDESVRRANDMYNSWINTKKSSDGYTSLLEANANQVTLAVAGKVYSPATADKSDRYDGEGILALNISDGSVVSQTPCQMLAASESGDFNAYKDLNIQKLDSARALIAVHDIYVTREDKVERIPFGEETLTFINTGNNTVTFMANHDDDYYDYWRIDISQSPSRKHLIARSTHPNVVFQDSADVSTTLNITEEKISAYPLHSGDVTDATFASPKWSLSESDLDKMGLGDLGNKVEVTNQLQGIRIIGGDVCLMGDDAIGYVSSDGSCKWSQEWSPKMLETKMGVTKVGNHLVYATGGEACILGTECPTKVVAKHEIDFSDTMILLSSSGDAVIVDMDEGMIRGYKAQ